MSQRQERMGRTVAVEREYLAASVAADLLQERLGADPAFFASHELRSRDARNLRAHREGTLLQPPAFALVKSGQSVVAAMDDFACEHLGGQVRTRRVEWETLRGNFVIQEYVPIGVCDRGAASDFDASILRRVAEVDSGRASREQTLDVHVARCLAAVSYRRHDLAPVLVPGGAVGLPVGPPVSGKSGHS